LNIVRETIFLKKNHYKNQRIITFLSPLQGLPSSKLPHKVISFYSIGRCKLTVASIAASIVISKFLHCTILVTSSAKSFFQQNLNLTYKGQRRQNGFLHFWAGCCEYNMFVDFLKLFEALNMDGSFPMKHFM
jgi:hypothetical protein